MSRVVVPTSDGKFTCVAVIEDVWVKPVGTPVVNRYEVEIKVKDDMGGTTNIILTNDQAVELIRMHGVPGAQHLRNKLVWVEVAGALCNYLGGCRA